jgi:hypothetical protein
LGEGGSVSNEAANAVYELVDATNDEAYFTIGIFSSEGMAASFVDERKFDPHLMTDCDHDEYIKIELRERPLDRYSGAVLKTPRVWEWLNEYDEATDELMWVAIEGKE